jgi:hypothetical protein
MAIISISTPISGVNRSEGTSWGPLQSLYGVYDGVDFLKYPRDLESSTRSHSVLFTINEVQEVTLDEVVQGVSQSVSNLMSSTPKNLDETGTEYLESDTNAFDNFTEKFKSLTNSSIKSLTEQFVEGVRSTGEDVNRIRQSIAKKRTNTKAFIALYMPENVSFSYDPNYNDNITLASVAGATPLIGRAVSAITGAMENDFLKFVLNKAGYVFNPDAQVLFNGVGFRSFSMNFTFTPYSKKEAEDVKRIIKMFRMHSAPRRVSSAGGMFFIPPSIFNIDFNFKGTNNQYINRVGDCVIENIDVNYTPNGWSAHEDGSPVQTVITIQFKEIVIVDREMIEKQGF